MSKAHEQRYSDPLVEAASSSDNNDLTEKSFLKPDALNFPWQEDKNEDPTPRTAVKNWWGKSVERHKRRFDKRVRRYTWVDWLGLIFPCVEWLRTYNVRDYLPNDLIAGISVGIMVIPQGMSYASIAGVPSVYGLYGAFTPLLFYAMLGSSRQLAVGPVAVTSLLIFNNMHKLFPKADCIKDYNNPANGVLCGLTPEEAIAIQDDYNSHTIQLAFLVSCFYTAMGVLNLSFITNFLSHAVISGFTTGASVMIALGQVNKLIGYSYKSYLEPKDGIISQLTAMYDGRAMFRWQEFIMGSVQILVLLIMKEIGKRYKKFFWVRSLGPITVCIIGLVCVYGAGVNKMGIKIVGPIPSGLPKPSVHMWIPIKETGIFLTALIVMCVDLLESTSIARAMAYKNKYKLNQTREVIGLGLANFAGAAFSAYTTTGSFSRTSVNDTAGAKTPLAGFITAWVVAICLLFLTGVCANIPQNSMAAIVIGGVIGLFDYPNGVFLFKVNKLDFLVWLTSFMCVVFISIDIGLACSIGLAIMIVIYRSAFPQVAVLGRVQQSMVYRNIRQYPKATTTPGILLVRIDAPLYFANVNFIRAQLNKFEAQAERSAKEHGLKLHFLVMDLSPVTSIDATGLHSLDEWITECRQDGIQVVICNPCPAVVKELDNSGVADDLGREWIFVRVHDAVQSCQRTLSERGFVCLNEVADLAYHLNSDSDDDFIK